LSLTGNLQVAGNLNVDGTTDLEFISGTKLTLLGAAANDFRSGLKTALTVTIQNGGLFTQYLSGGTTGTLRTVTKIGASNIETGALTPGSSTAADIYTIGGLTALLGVYFGSTLQVQGQTTLNSGLSVNGTISIPTKTYISLASGGPADSDTISSTNYDTTALGIIGHGTSPNRNIHLWDNVIVEQEITSRGTTFSSLQSQITYLNGLIPITYFVGGSFTLPALANGPKKPIIYVFNNSGGNIGVSSGGGAFYGSGYSNSAGPVVIGPYSCKIFGNDTYNYLVMY